MTSLYSMTPAGPELCHSALAEACERELVERIMRGNVPAWIGFYETADAYDLAWAARSALEARSDANVAMGALTTGIEKLAKEYAVGYVEHAADKGAIEDLGREFGLLTEEHEP